ncbi:MAG: phage tail tape measure protein, partial [Candidatus Ruthia sp.]|nr:phage tail tape measure protein [Candidatus Ruthturnera sp.]
MANIGTLTVVIDGQTFKLEKAVKKAQGQVQGFTKKSTSGFKTMKQSILSARSAVIAFGAVSALLVGKIFGSAVKEAGNFEESLGKINSLMENSNLVFGEFRSGVIDLSKEFGRSKIDLATGLKDIIDATIPASEAMDVLRASAKLAVGGFTDVTTATSATISTFQLYRNELKDATEATDFLFATQKRGRLTLEDLAKNIGTVIGVAKSAGVSLQDLGQGFAMISRVAKSAPKTAVQFAALIKTFTQTQSIDSQRLAFEKFGVTLNSTAIKNGKLIESILKFKDASAEELSIIFKNVRALRAATAILNQKAKAQEDAAEIAGKAGITDRVTMEAQKLFNEQMKVFVEHMNDLKLAFGGELLSSLTLFAKIFISLKNSGVLNVLFLPGFRIAIAGLDAFIKEMEKAKKIREGMRELEKQSEIFISSGGNMNDLRGGLSREDIPKGGTGSSAAENLKSDLVSFGAEIKRFKSDYDKVTKSSTDFAIVQFQREAQEFEILVRKKLISQKDFDEFRTKGLQQIRLKNDQTFQTMASAAKNFGDDFTDT